MNTTNTHACTHRTQTHHNRRESITYIHIYASQIHTASIGSNDKMSFCVVVKKRVVLVASPSMTFGKVIGQSPDSDANCHTHNVSTVLFARALTTDWIVLVKICANVNICKCYSNTALFRFHLKSFFLLRFVVVAAAFFCRLRWLLWTENLCSERNYELV